MSWINSGTYVSDNYQAAMGFDVLVYKPDGTTKASKLCDGWSGFSFVDFDPTVSGNYRLRIARALNRDTSSKVSLGVAVTSN